MNKWIVVCVFLIISLSSSLIIILWGSSLNLNTSYEKWGVGVLIVLGLGFLFLVPVFSQTLWLVWSKRYSDSKKLNPAITENKYDCNNTSINITWEELKQHRNRNDQTRRKPLLGIVGDVQLLSDALPELHAHTWIETPDAFFVDLQKNIPSKQINKSPVDAILSVFPYDHLHCTQVDELANVLMKLQWNIPIYAIGLDNQTYQNGYECCIAHSINLEKLAQVDVIPVEWTQTFNVYITQMLEQDLHADFLMRLQQFLNQHQQEVLAYFKYSIQRINPAASIQRWIIISADTHHLIRNIIEGVGSIPRSRRKISPRWNKICRGICLIAAFFCIFMFYSFFQNTSNIKSVNKQFEISQKVNETNQIQTLLNWQLLIQYLEQNNGGQNIWGMGMNKHSQLLQFSKQNYGEQMKIILEPALNQMVKVLEELNQITFQENKTNDIHYDTLKAYLMLTEQPEKTESTFLNKMLINYLPSIRNQDVQLILKFYTENLAVNPDWKLKGNEELINLSRRTLIHLIGITQADEQVYRRIMDNATQHYPEKTLADLIQKDYRGIWVSNRKLPSVYTDEAWNNYIKPAFLEASKQKGSAGDWVLAIKDSETSNDITEDKLKEYYFRDYQQAWYQFLNGITWSEQASIQDTAAQLRLYSDPQNSPLLALFSVIRKNSHPDEQKIGLADNLAQSIKRQVRTATSNVTPKVAEPMLRESLEQGNQLTDERLNILQENFTSPVKTAFSPLVQLVDPNENPTNELSLQRYLERIVGGEQKLKQIYQSTVPDDAAKQTVQSVLTGNNNEFTEGNRYAKLIEASLGEGLAPFAKQVFVQPFRISWTSISTSAQNSLNELWKKSILESWQQDFSGRYPFSDTDNEVAIPLLAKYLEPQQGLIDQFIQQQLSGLVMKQGERWVASSEQIMQVNPEFLEKINQLKLLSQDLFFHGNTGYVFQLKPIPTANLVYYSLSIDGQNLEYFNQKAQWQNFRWPGDVLKAGTLITWESLNGGLQKGQEFNGRWGFIRLLEQARIEQIDRSTYLLEWELKNAHVVRMYLRTTSGKGPLALLGLKTTKLPEMVFISQSTETLMDTKPAR